MIYKRRFYLCGRYPLLLFLLLQVLFYSIPVNAQTIKDNVVKITARYPDNSKNTCFGFIFGEKDDSLYIVTSADMLISDYQEFVESVDIEYYQRNYTSNAKPVYLFHDETCLLLQAEKPEEFIWNDLFCSSTFLESNDIVWIVGRYGNWNDYSREFIGQVVSAHIKEIIIDLKARTAGAPGAPVIADDCIAGMVINDEGNQVTAVDIELIRIYVCDYLDIPSEQEFEQPYYIPYLIAGTNAGIPMFTKGIKYPSTNNYGIFLETSFLPYIAFRFQGVRSNIVSYPYSVWDSTYRFRNNCKLYSLSLLVIGEPDKFENSNAYLSLGYASIHHNPELQVNNNNWTSLKNINEFNNEYKQKYSAFLIGFGANGFLTEWLILGFDLSLQYHLNKYLYIDPLEPFADNKRNDWMLQLKFQAGIVLGNKEPKLKFLKPEKRNPFKL
jgi:hypothetical protein